MGSGSPSVVASARLLDLVCDEWGRSGQELIASKRRVGYIAYASPCSSASEYRACTRSEIQGTLPITLDRFIHPAKDRTALIAIRQVQKITCLFPTTSVWIARTPFVTSERQTKSLSRSNQNQYTMSWSRLTFLSVNRGILPYSYPSLSTLDLGVGS